jgi:aminopeptidase
VLDDADLARRLAELVVGFGANVQPGQVVAVTTTPGKEQVTRAVARAAYERGARWVDVVSFDPWLKRARVELAPEDSLDFVPPWLVDRLEWLSRERGARISLSGPTALHALDGLDPSRTGRDLLPYLPNTGAVVNRRTTNWCVAPAPSRGWAAAVYPEAEPDDAYERLWRAIEHVCRLDADDPEQAWRERTAAVAVAAEWLDAHRFDAIHLQGPGTDLTVGLLPSSTWHAGGSETAAGIGFFSNIPSEETFTGPDPRRAEGVVTATRPLHLHGSLIDGIRVEFRDGRAVRIDADRGADALRAAAAKDDGASRLGELALVDGEGRVGELATVFHDTLLDENAASHIALGNAYLSSATDEDDKRLLNRSGIHVDFMIGSPELAVDGITRSGERVPVMRDGGWLLPETISA